MPDRARPIIVIGIDPGTRFTGYGVVERQGARLIHRAHGVINLTHETSFDQKLLMLSGGLAVILGDLRPNLAAIEKVFAGKNMATALRSAEGRGVIRFAMAFHKVPLVEFAAREVKQAVTGRGSASKQQVAAMVGTILGIPTPDKEDAADALAIAICAIQRGGVPESQDLPTATSSPKKSTESPHPRDVLAALMQGSKRPRSRRSR